MLGERTLKKRRKETINFFVALFLGLFIGVLIEGFIGAMEIEKQVQAHNEVLKSYGIDDETLKESTINMTLFEKYYFGWEVQSLKNTYKFNYLVFRIGVIGVLVCIIYFFRNINPSFIIDFYKYELKKDKNFEDFVYEMPSLFKRKIFRNKYHKISILSFDDEKKKASLVIKYPFKKFGLNLHQLSVEGKILQVTSVNTNGGHKNLEKMKKILLKNKLKSVTSIKHTKRDFNSDLYCR